MLNHYSLRKEFQVKRRLLGIPVEHELASRPLWQKVLFFVALVGVCLIGSCQPAHAYTDEQAVRTIVGEASNQGFEGMVAVGEVIRTRCGLKGLYGFKNPQADREPSWVWKQARKAWKTSKTSHLVNGATHFENIKAFGKPKWADSMVKVAVIKDHVFYKGE